jgi:acyl-CoA hydrolase
MIEEIQQIDKIEIIGEFKHIQYRIANIVIKDGVEIARTNSRKIISPGQDYSNEPEEIKQLCSFLHTEELITSYLEANE